MTSLQRNQDDQGVVERHTNVLHCIMQLREHHAPIAEPHLLRTDPRHRNGMENVGFPAAPTHVLFRF